MGSESWAIWLNSQRISSTTKVRGIEVLSVDREAVQLRLALANQEQISIRLELRQSYVFSTGRIVNGTP